MFPSRVSYSCFTFCVGTCSLARAACQGAYYVKELTKWWDDYDYEETVVIDDLTPSLAAELAPLLFRWCGLYKVRVEIKNGSITIRPRTVIISSAYTIAECFPLHYVSSMTSSFPRIEAIGA